MGHRPGFSHSSTLWNPLPGGDCPSFCQFVGEQVGFDRKVVGALYVSALESLVGLSDVVAGLMQHALFALAEVAVDLAEPALGVAQQVFRVLLLRLHGGARKVGGDLH